MCMNWQDVTDSAVLHQSKTVTNKFTNLPSYNNHKYDTHDFLKISCLCKILSFHRWKYGDYHEQAEVRPPYFRNPSY